VRRRDREAEGSDSRDYSYTGIARPPEEHQLYATFLRIVSLGWSTTSQIRRLWKGLQRSSHVIYAAYESASVRGVTHSQRLRWRCVNRATHCCRRRFDGNCSKDDCENEVADSQFSWTTAQGPIKVITSDNLHLAALPSATGAPCPWHESHDSLAEHPSPRFRLLSAAFALPVSPRILRDLLRGNRVAGWINNA